LALFHKSYHAEIEINAAKEKVWSILIDLENYSQWNEFTPQIKTDWQIGSEVLLTVQMKEGTKPLLQKEIMIRYNPKSDFSWGLNWGVFLKAERVQRLVEKDNLTIYLTTDTISGPLTPIVDLLYGKKIQNGFERVAKGLKAYAERSK